MWKSHQPSLVRSMKLRQDDLLDFTFLQAFKQGLADDKALLLSASSVSAAFNGFGVQALPIEASELYEKHMKPARQGMLAASLC